MCVMEKNMNGGGVLSRVKSFNYHGIQQRVLAMN